MEKYQELFDSFKASLNEKLSIAGSLDEIKTHLQKQEKAFLTFVEYQTERQVKLMHELFPNTSSSSPDDNRAKILNAEEALGKELLEKLKQILSS